MDHQLTLGHCQARYRLLAVQYSLNSSLVSDWTTSLSLSHWDCAQSNGIQANCCALILVASFCKLLSANWLLHRSELGTESNCLRKLLLGSVWFFATGVSYCSCLGYGHYLASTQLSSLSFVLRLSLQSWPDESSCPSDWWWSSWRHWRSHC